MDVAVAGGALTVGAPVLAAVGLAVRVGLGSPVLFRQERPGLHGRPFTLLKFRTMKPEAPSARGPESDSVRLTRFGRFLRATSLDELPTFVNVLKGDMSLVGPRPLLMQYLELYSEEQMRRHEVPPGITGWAQVNGRNALTWEEKFAHDVWYVDNWSLGLDLRILLQTASKVVAREGISAPGAATMPVFSGSSVKPAAARAD
jgi:lipopolysaccharide/colanic/teichoic acid biosynthesis glycosyltransferase